MSDIPVFIGALAVAYMVPGPDMIFLLQTGTAQGRAQALVATLGLAGARASHVVFAAVGLAALFRTAPHVFAAVRFAGAAYLIWLGIGLWRTRSMIPDRDVAASTGARRGGRTVIRAFLTNLLNPKPLIFCSVLLPQFVYLGAGPVLMQFAMLGAILVGIGFLFDAIYALWGAALGRWLARRPTVQAGQRYAFATVLIGFGAELIVMRAPH